MKGLIESQDKYISKRKSSFRNHPLYPSLISDDAPITSSGHSKSHKVGMPVSFRLNALATWLVTFLCLSLTFFYKWKFYLQNFTRTKKHQRQREVEKGGRRKHTTASHDLQPLKHVYTQCLATEENALRRPDDGREKHLQYNFDLTCIVFFLI